MDDITGKVRHINAGQRSGSGIRRYPESMRKTSITLPDDLYAAWKRSKLPAVEVWRRGLEGTGDATRHAATETRLAQIEARLAQVEARVYVPTDLDLGLLAPDEGRTPEQIHAELAEARHARLTDMHAQLWDRGHRQDVTAADALSVWGTTPDTARSTMQAIAALGLADQHPHKPGSGRPYVWDLLPASAAPSPAAEHP